MVAKWGRSLAKRTESCLPVEGTRRRTPRFPPSCESSTFLRGHGEIYRAETIGERQSGYSTVHFVKYSQFTDRLLLHRWFTLRRARHNSAAQPVYTLLRLSPLRIKLLINAILQGTKFLLLQSKTTVKTTVVCVKCLNQTLKRNRTTSPSCITYSLPSERTRPFSRAAASEPSSMRSL